MKNLKVANPTTVAVSIEHLLMACHVDNEQYSDNLSIVLNYMSEFVPELHSVPNRLILRKRHITTIKHCAEVCKNPNCSEEFCFNQIQKALKEMIEPALPTLGAQTKKHLLTLAKEVPHMENIFMEFHDKIAA
ncbi:MAG: hypothetical protein WCO66_00200 [Candidatus Absconditabacteria bacterium]